MNRSFQEQIRFNKRAWGYSIALHVALFALAMNMPVVFEIEAPEFHELSFGAVSSEQVRQIIENARRAEEIQARQQQSSSPEERVEVPDRKMLEIEEPSVSVSAEQRDRSHELIRNAERQSLEVTAPSIGDNTNTGSIFSMDRKESFQGSRITIGDEPGAGMETGTIGSDLTSFTIEGEIKGREIIYNPLPEYPEGLNKNATIKIRFNVLPDGSVSSFGMVPLRKENAVLEDLTMNKLKLWRFSKLPQGDERTQTGVITMKFRVK